MNRINLNELTLENFSQWPGFLKYFILITLAALLVTLNYWFIVKPNFAHYIVLFNQEINLRSEFETKQQMANLQAYQEQLQMMHKEYGKMLKQLATKNEMSSLLDDISKTGIASGLTFELFAPQSEKTHDFYIELAIHIIVIGEYQQLALFISRIAEFNRLVIFHDFEILHGSIEKKKTSSELKLDDLLRMKMTVKIYRSYRQ